MYYKNMIPGMKVITKGHVGRNGEKISHVERTEYIVRNMKRTDEIMNKDRCVVSYTLSKKEGNYACADDIILLELPKSFDKRNERYK